MLCFIRVVLVICLLCRSISVASCMELEQDTEKLVRSFLKRVEFRLVSAELEKKAIENIKRVSATDQIINQEILAREVVKFSSAYSSRVEEIFGVSYLQSGFKDFHVFFAAQLKKLQKILKEISSYKLLLFYLI